MCISIEPPPPAAIASMEIDAQGNPRKIKLWDKPRALEMAMKHLGLYERDNTRRGMVQLAA